MNHFGQRDIKVSFILFNFFALQCTLQINILDSLVSGRPGKSFWDYDTKLINYDIINYLLTSRSRDY